MKKYGAGLLLTALLVTAGCGSSSPSSSGASGAKQDSARPSVSQVSAALRKGGKASLLPAGVVLNRDASDCIAKSLVASKISDSALKALLKGDKTFKPTAADSAALKGLNATLIGCVTSNVG
ncbi:MAG: hypothetical protein JWP74_3094 [Marmoricola sp.]|nr:hypothetical protein [Marmoricola sp.]